MTLTLVVEVPIDEDDDAAEVSARLMAWMVRMSLDTGIPIRARVEKGAQGDRED